MHQVVFKAIGINLTSTYFPGQGVEGGGFKIIFILTIVSPL